MANAKSNGITLTKADLAKVRAKDAKMTGAQKRAASKALVEANTAANSIGRYRQKKKA